MSLKIGVIFGRGKGKGKLHRTTGHEGPEEYRYSSTLSLTSALHGEWVVNATPRPLYPRERNPVPIVYEDVWASEAVWTGAENLAPTEIRSPDHPVALPTTLSRPSFFAQSTECFRQRFEPSMSGSKTAASAGMVP